MATHILGQASEFAILRHTTQMYGRKPYHVHLLDVVDVLRRFIDWDDLPQEFVDAAWLHDVIEDTLTTREQVEALFGTRVASLVHAVTNEKGANRAERHAKTYPKVIATDAAIVIKLADRIANIEQSISHDRLGRPPQKIFGMYDKEFAGFRDALMLKCLNTTHAQNERLMWDYLIELMVEGRGKAEAFKNLKSFRGEV